ncbi:uncharacterized protein LOC134432141 [Melospiza melodia melodia]|uniref:uncharacterized protein LOC134432141 n=1 Tax=Melospiza melodia melodia TaxID=1914991 RepID=UPI002FD1633D
MKKSSTSLSKDAVRRRWSTNLIHLHFLYTSLCPRYLQRKGEDSALEQLSLFFACAVISRHPWYSLYQTSCFAFKIQSQHWAEAAKEEKNKGNSFTIFFHLVTKRTSRITTTSTTTIKMDVLQHRSLASRERAVSEGCRGLTTSPRGGIEAFEDRQQAQTCLEGHRASPRGTPEAAPLPGGPEARLPRHGGHPAVANSCLSAPAAPRPSAGSAPPASPPLRGGGGGGTESDRPGGF